MKKLANGPAALLMLTATLAAAQAPSEDRYGAAVVAGHLALFQLLGTFQRRTE